MQSCVIYHVQGLCLSGSLGCGNVSSFLVFTEHLAYNSHQIADFLENSTPGRAPILTHW